MTLGSRQFRRAPRKGWGVVTGPGFLPGGRARQAQSRQAGGRRQSSATSRQVSWSKAGRSFNTTPTAARGARPTHRRRRRSAASGGPFPGRRGTRPTPPRAGGGGWPGRGSRCGRSRCARGRHHIRNRSSPGRPIPRAMKALRAPSNRRGSPFRGLRPRRPVRGRGRPPLTPVASTSRETGWAAARAPAAGGGGHQRSAFVQGLGGAIRPGDLSSRTIVSSSAGRKASFQRSMGLSIASFSRKSSSRLIGAETKACRRVWPRKVEVPGA